MKSDDPQPRSQLNPKSLFRYALQAVVLGVLASSLVFFYSLEGETTNALRAFRWEILLIIFPMIFTAWVCQALRILVLSRSLGYRLTFGQCFSIAMSLEFGIAATPAAVGGTIIRLGLLRRAGVPIAHGTSMLAIDVVIDAMIFLLILPLAVWAILSQPTVMHALEDVTPEGVIVLFCVFGAIVVGAVLLVRTGMFIRMMRHVASWPFGQRYRLAPRLRWYEGRFMREWNKTKQGVHQLYAVQRWALVVNFLLGVVQWFCRYGVLPMLLYALSVPVNPFLLMLLQGVLFSLSVMVVLPGGGGSVEVLALLILRGLIPPHMVGVVVLLWRFFTYYLYLLGGGAVFFYTLSRLQRLFPKDEADARDGLDLSRETSGAAGVSKRPS